MCTDIEEATYAPLSILKAVTFCGQVCYIVEQGDPNDVVGMLEVKLSHSSLYAVSEAISSVILLGMLVPISPTTLLGSQPQTCSVLLRLEVYTRERVTSISSWHLFLYLNSLDICHTCGLLNTFCNNTDKHK